MTPMHDRMQTVVGRRSYRQLAEMTSHNAETVRRYMQGASPSVEFLIAFCESFGVSATWLLTGRGTTYLKDATSEALTVANPGELLTQVAAILEKLVTRMDRIETYVQTLEARLRHANPESKDLVTRATKLSSERAELRSGAEQRAGFVADALPKRPSQDDG